MLKFSRGQMRRFEERTWHEYRAQLIDKLARLEPRFGRDPTMTADYALAFAPHVGLTGRDSILGCAILAMAYGSDWLASDPSASAIRDASRPEFARKTEIHKRLVALDTPRDV